MILRVINLLMVAVFSMGTAFALEYDVQSNVEDAFDNSRNFVVEIEYADKFHKESFESKTKEILAQIKANPQLREIKIDLENHSQSIFIERYFKINSNDAFINEKGILIITPKN